MSNTYSFVVLLILIVPRLTSAETIGVAETNFSLSGSYSSSISEDDFGSLTGKGNSIVGLATMALGKYGGATGYLDYSKNTVVELESESTSKTYGGLLFLRNATIGRVGISYSIGKVEPEKYMNYLNDKNNTIVLSSSSVRNVNTVFMDYYYNDFSLAIEQNRVELINSDPRFKDTINTTSSLSGIWHVNKNLLLRVSTFLKDYKNSNGITLIYQPKFLNRSTSLSLKYFKRKTEIDSTSTVLSVAFYFGTRVSLKDRERKYSGYLYSNDIN